VRTSSLPSLAAGPQLRLPSPTPPPAIAAELRLLTWNVQHAAPARAKRQVSWLMARQVADVLVLTEVANTPGGRMLVLSLAEHGYSVHVSADAGGDYFVLVATRRGRLEPVATVRAAHLPHRLAVARLHLPDGSAATVIGMYVPSRGPKDRRNVDKRAFQDAVVAVLPRLGALMAEGPVMIAGDLNVVEPGHQPHHPLFGGWEYDFYKAFRAAGFVDAFRQLHPTAAEHSWFGRRSGAGYRFDHVFCSLPHFSALLDCRYLHTPREQGLSDHSAMLAILALTSG
jgi:exodeoxyribonuclease III